MKELSIEQKAKRYDETLEQLKGLIEGAREDKCAIVEEDIIGIFPELAESEYEKIRKELIEHFQGNAQILNDIDNREVIAWLENQVKKKPIEWTDSDEVYFQHILLAIKTSMFYTEEDRDKLVDWFKLLKQRIVNNNE